MARLTDLDADLATLRHTRRLARRSLTSLDTAILSLVIRRRKLLDNIHNTSALERQAAEAKQEVADFDDELYALRRFGAMDG